THTILADMHLRLGNLDSAGESLASAQQAASQVGATRLQPWIALSLRQWHRACGRILDAVDAIEEALRLGTDIVDRELLVHALVVRAELAILQEDQGKARELLARAQAEAQQIGRAH